MAIQQIIGKRIVKYDTDSPNFKQPEPKKVEEVERGKNAEETSEGIHKSPEVK